MTESILPPAKAQEVVEFLTQNPTFFAEYPQLLERLVLPHPQGENAVSLVERQLQQFRQQRDSLKSEFMSLLNIAGENNSLFEKVMQFTLSLLATQNETQALQQIEQQLQTLFVVDCVKIFSFEMPKRSVAGIQQLGMSSRWSELLNGLLQPKTPYCGALEKEWREGLFADNGQVSSTCLLPLGETRVWGVLALGRYDLGYENDFGHFFLRLISQIVTAKLIDLFEDDYQPVSTLQQTAEATTPKTSPAETLPGDKIIPISRAVSKAD
ncbi:hypothetical protein THMIRHAS_04410 [Thiosulfatimonas sediminis]|uniref:DUF484 domain-containing protein n=1 Tax=Thiosulfatimonas sediminis TaxID=2675054 RepID=A0A6F8PSS3_9GAMM|nr:DUF484 family protein [Thiosulfatimonas sediminis]BBP45068.1 hypothetical protein THMIRHAS_04410 [Thiosulfatimonas sediminis]